MKSRHWSIRSKIIALVTVPLTALLALWIFATTLTAGPAFNLLSAQTLLDAVGIDHVPSALDVARARRVGLRAHAGFTRLSRWRGRPEPTDASVYLGLSWSVKGPAVASVHDPPERQTARRRDRPGGAAIQRSQDPGDIARVDPSGADRHERAAVA